MKLFDRLNYLLIAFVCVLSVNSYAAQKIVLAQNKVSQVVIVIPIKATATQQYAGNELARYLKLMSGAGFAIVSSLPNKLNAIFIETDVKKQNEDYSIVRRPSGIILSGGSDRAVLYAVYDLLSRLGCQWLAPNYSFYNGAAEYVPVKPFLVYDGTVTVNEHPAFAYRKLDVEEGQSHNIDNLKQLIEWMPKARFNTLMIPLDYQGSGRVKWDKWRDELTPELKKRGLMIEVGGHGYQNFLNAGMENGELFKQHPEWFGKDKNCKPSAAEYMVFNTTDRDAMAYFTDHVLAYLKQHPEIDIFDLWPPDVAHWADCPEWQSWGTPEDRQARLLNHVDSAIKAYRPDLKIEIIAYAKTISPPQSTVLNKAVLVDICPIDQNFETQIYDTVAPANVNYSKAIQGWRKKFEGDIGLYSYFRKYAWKSLPNVIPHYIQHDMQWYAKVPLQGISTYAEPGDWYTYELNHFILGQLAWNVNADVNMLIHKYCKIRYGISADIAEKAYATLENTVRFYGTIRNSAPKTKEEIGKALAVVNDQVNILNKETTSSSGMIKADFSRLLLMYRYAAMDLRLRELIAAKSSPELIEEKIKELLLFMQNNKSEGTLILGSHESVQNLIKNYAR